jgi:hypothetical protein
MKPAGENRLKFGKSWSDYLKTQMGFVTKPPAGPNFKTVYIAKVVEEWEVGSKAVSN